MLDYSLKNIVLESLSLKNDKLEYVSSDTISTISDISFNKKEDYVKLDFETTFNTSPSLIVKFSRYSNWMNNNKGKKPIDFLKDYLDSSEEVVNEIVDDNNNIIDNSEIPPNSTNSMVGSSVWDLDKVYNQSIPKARRMYTGDLGVGIVVW